MGSREVEENNYGDVASTILYFMDTLKPAEGEDTSTSVQ